jgi:anti-sigma-K factor RskA
MRQDDVHDLAVPYAVDAVDERERAIFEAHLPGCPDCTDLVDELQEAAVGLSEGLEVEPPARLRAAVLAQVETETAAGAEAGAGPGNGSTGDVLPLRRSAGAEGRSGTRRWWLAAAAAVLVGAGAWGASQALIGTDDPATQIAQSQDAQEHTATTEDGRVVTVVSSPSSDAALLRFQDLGDLTQDEVYQAWFIDQDETVRSAGTLSAQALQDGQAVLQGELGRAAAVGLTVEPAGGSDQPTSTPFAVVELG